MLFSYCILDILVFSSKEMFLNNCLTCLWNLEITCIACHATLADRATLAGIINENAFLIFYNMIYISNVIFPEESVLSFLIARIILILSAS